MGSQISGFTSANIAEVEAANKALRSVLYPEDYTTNGNYANGSASGAMAAGLASNSPIYAFQWTHATKSCLIKRVLFSAGNSATAFTAGACVFNMFGARAFSVMDTGGTLITPTGNVDKLKTSMATSQVAAIRIASTGTLTAGTRTKDGIPMGALVGAIPNVAGSVIMPPFPIFEAYPGEYPLVLVQNEGFVIEAIVPATGTWQFGVKVEWGERDSYF
jgi:hypothetical protein